MCLAQNIRHIISAVDCGQQRLMTATIEKGKGWELAQRESNKKDDTKLTPLPIDPHGLYFTAIMPARCSCDLLSF